MNVNFGENLKELISCQSMTPESLASALHFSRSNIYAWINNETEIRLSNLLVVANFFNCSIEFLIGRESMKLPKIFKKCPPFYQRLRNVMNEKGITTYRLIKLTHISSKHLYNWAHGTDPQLSSLIILADILNCTVDYLVGRE